MMSSELEHAVGAVREAAKLVRDGAANRRAVRPEKKGGSWVTNVDRSCEEMIREWLAKRYPDHGFLGEESGLVGNAERCWVVDPLDGTTNYVHGYPEYCISVALVSRGQSVAGVVYDVNRDDLYTAERGRGMYCNGRRRKQQHDRQLSESLVVSLGGTGSEPWMRRMNSALQRRCDGVRRSGCSALDLAMVGAGFFGGFFGYGMRYWDYAAGSLMVRENGGLMVPLDPGEFKFGETAGFMLGGMPGVVAELRNHALRLRAREG